MSLPLRQDSAGRNVLVFTVHKAATTFLNRLTAGMTGCLGMEYQTIGEENHAQMVQKGWKYFIEAGGKGRCFGPIRLGAAEPSVPGDLGRYSVVVHMRDPRDVLTSLFFSHVYSHGRAIFDPGDEARRKWKENGIDKFVLERALEGKCSFRDRYDLFVKELSGRENVLVLRYEDMVLDYRTWLERFLTAFSDWAEEESPPGSVGGSKRSLSALHGHFHEKYKGEFSVPSEDIYRHKRQVHPGDHRRKLRPGTVSELSSIFSDSLRLLGYNT